MQSNKSSSYHTSDNASIDKDSHSGSTIKEQESENNEESATLQNELRGTVVSLAQQQTGSKQLQRYLEKAAPDLVEFIIEEVIHDLHQLMSDQYGNYFCQKLMVSSSSAQRLKILRELRPNVLKISCDKRGTHSMQCLIEMINMPEEEEEIKQSIQDHILNLAFDSNGNHVLQKVLICIKENNTDFIFIPVLSRFVDLSMDQNGLGVIKKIISKILDHDKVMKMSEVLGMQAVKLVQSPYGNYAV